MTERWFQLLSCWQDREFRHSLTFPFLIGALRNPIGAVRGYENAGLGELKTLINSIRAHQATDHVLHIYRCGDRDKLVITRVRGTNPPPYAIPISPATAGAKAVLFASLDTKTDASPASPDSLLISAIWSECGVAVEQGLFSCRGRQFQPFNEDELKFIQRAVA